MKSAGKCRMEISSRKTLTSLNEADGEIFPDGCDTVSTEVIYPEVTGIRKRFLKKVWLHVQRLARRQTCER